MDRDMRDACEAAITVFESLAGKQVGKDHVRCVDDCEGGCYDRIKCTGDITNGIALGGGVAGGLTA